MTGEEGATIPDLDSLIQTARVAQAQRRSNEAAIAEVVRMLADREGCMPLRALLSEGAPRDVVALMVAEDPTDKRRKQRARLGFIGADPVVWLTSTGWQASGLSSGRERPPTADSISHAMTPIELARWLDARAAALHRHGIHLRVATGAVTKSWSQDVMARAWGLLKGTSDVEGTVGSLTGGLIPDALVVERFPIGEPGAALHERLRGGGPVDDDELAESTYAVEAEESRKATGPLRGKVDRLETACEKLHAARGVLWIVKTREVADRLRDLGVDSPRRPSQILVPAREIGLAGEDIGLVSRPWWVTRVPAEG